MITSCFFFQGYQAINIRLVVTALEIQTEDRFYHSKDDSFKTLLNYTNYVGKTLKHSEAMKDISFDHGLFYR